jgi:hypothetical protein
VLELVGGALLVRGLFVRPVAFVLSGLMAAGGDAWSLDNTLRHRRRM